MQIKLVRNNRYGLISAILGNSLLTRGHCEDGPTALSKKFKTPLFKRYSKTLLRG